MKKIIISVLIVCAVIVIYFFYKEQFQGATLSKNENMVLSITYIVIGITIFMMYRIRYREKKNESGQK